MAPESVRQALPGSALGVQGPAVAVVTVNTLWYPSREGPGGTVGEEREVGHCQPVLSFRDQRGEGSGL